MRLALLLYFLGVWPALVNAFEDYAGHAVRPFIAALLWPITAIFSMAGILHGAWVALSQDPPEDE